MFKINFSYSLLIVLTLLIIGCSKNEKPVKKWYKGNLHAHSYWSDGQEFPEMVMDWYKSNGYNFTVLSDHNTLAEREKWITLSERDYLQKGFENYLNKYGEEWVDFVTDSVGKIKVKLKTYNEYRSLYEKDPNFLIIQSEEISAKFGNKPIHINATNIQEKIDPLDGESTVEVVQNNINAILEQRKESKVPIMPHINHPNYKYSISASDFVQLKNVRFFEVYNGHPLDNGSGDSLHLSTEQMWDVINISYFLNNQKPIYAIAADDSHQYNRFSKKYSNPGRGWVMVNTELLSAESIINAMEKGNFYATTGIVLKDFSFDSNILKIEVEQEENTNYEIEFIGVNRHDRESKLVKKVNGNKAEFKLTNHHMFIRLRVISNRTNENFFNEMEFEKAWTQPVFYQKE